MDILVELNPNASWKIKMISWLKWKVLKMEAWTKINMDSFVKWDSQLNKKME